MNLRMIVLGVGVPLLFACDDKPATPTADSSSKAASSSSPSASSASAKPVASSAPTTPSASAVPSASASASSPASSASASTPLVPSETPSAAPPTADDFKAETKEIAVRASGEQKCSTKVLHGWFEISCGPADNLIRATKVEIISGFSKTGAVTEAAEGTTFRWVAALPSDGSVSQARMYGAKMHEIWITLTNTDKGWKGELTGKQP